MHVAETALAIRFNLVEFFCPLLRSVLRTSLEKWKGVSAEVEAELGGAVEEDENLTPAGLGGLFEGLVCDNAGADSSGGASGGGGGGASSGGGGAAAAAGGAAPNGFLDFLDELARTSADENLAGALGCGDAESEDEGGGGGEEEVKEEKKKKKKKKTKKVEVAVAAAAAEQRRRRVPLKKSSAR
jgi:hypothetical protein